MRQDVSDRILYQSFGPESNRAYLDVLTASVGRASVAFGVVAEVRGLATAVLAEKQHRAFHLAAGAALVDSIHRAQAEGFSAAVIGNIQDPALYESRQICRIPVVGMLESLLAGTRPFGASIALISSAPRVLPVIRERVLLYGDDRRMVGFDTVDVSLQEIALAFEDRNRADDCSAQFVAAARRAVAGGAELVAPASGILATLLCTVFGNAAGWDLGIGAPVVNPVWVALGTAAAAARCARAGMTISRIGTYEAPSQAALDAYFRARPQGATSSEQSRVPSAEPLP